MIPLPLSCSSVQGWWGPTANHASWLLALALSQIESETPCPPFLSCHVSWENHTHRASYFRCHWINGSNSHNTLLNSLFPVLLHFGISLVILSLLLSLELFSLFHPIVCVFTDFISGFICCFSKTLNVVLKMIAISKSLTCASALLNFLGPIIAG